MTAPLRITDLTSPAPKGGLNTATPIDFLNLAVASGNAAAEASRVEVTRGEVTSRIISYYAERAKQNGSELLRSPRQITGSQTEQARPEPRISAPPIRPVDWTRANTFVALQEWEGTVLNVSEHEFVASLTDLTAGMTRATEQATIPLSEINDDDVPKVTPGRIFRWAIGYLRLKAGTKKRVSNIVFRDLPRWSRRDLADAEADAERIMRFLDAR